MIFPLIYSCLYKAEYKDSEISLKAIRFEDKDLIREWRNEQIDILRQKHILTADEQDSYFLNQVKSLFFEENPKQILFSIFENDLFIGYGGLVHINWKDKNAEISFLLDTKKNTEKEYLKLFEKFLELIQKVAIDLNLHKIFSYGYDIEKYRFYPLIKLNFEQEVLLKNHIKIRGNTYDVKIYSKIL